jgi:serine/threonine protein phosphatase PrpC
MARAFGDFCLKDFGLISVPEVTYRRIIEKDEFIVLATDGVTKNLRCCFLHYFLMGNNSFFGLKMHHRLIYK